MSHLQVPELTPTEVQAKREDGSIVIVDCRNAEEQDISMIPGAVRRQDLDVDSTLKQGGPVVCYCTVGYRSALEAKSLINKGIDAYNLRGLPLGAECLYRTSLTNRIDTGFAAQGPSWRGH